MTTKNRRLISIIICAVCVLTLVLSGYTPPTESVNFDSSEIIPVYKHGIRVSDGIKIGDTTYTSLREFTDAIDFDIEIDWDDKTETALLTADGLEFSATVGEQYITANGRCFYIPDGVQNYEGTIVVPMRELAKIFNVEVIWNEEGPSITIDTENAEILQPAEEFYNEDDLFWLSRLINAESGNQPLEGKIGVGNVVINRVSDPTCPDNIKDVVFDNKYGVQFSVSTTSVIYNTPNEESVAAAKMCLEGYTVVPDDCIYFVNPVIGASSWFYMTRTYVCTIGEHDFYS